MFNCRNKKVDVFAIKTGRIEKIRLFFFILKNPWLTMQIIDEFRYEYGKLEEKLVEAQLKAAEAISNHADAIIEISRLKHQAK